MTKTYSVGMASTVDSFTDSTPTKKLFFYFMYLTYETLAGDPTFALSYEDATKKSSIKPSGALTNPLTPAQKDLFPKVAGNPTFSTILRCEPLPGAIVRVETKVPGGASTVQDFDFGAPVNGTNVGLALRKDQSPRLCLALNTTFAFAEPASGNFGAPTATEIKAILAHIHKRIVDGQAPAWTGPDGTPELPFTPAKTDTTEEQWAKTYAQMMTCTPYGLPSTHYSGTGGGFDDERFYDRFIDEADPGFAIVAECQHLVTLAYLSRGMRAWKTMKDPKGGPDRKTVLGFTAGDGSKSTVIALNGKFVDPSVIDNAQQSVANDITPGSSFVYNGFDPDTGKEMGNKGSAHIGFILRVDAAGKRIQAFDTGGLNVPAHDVPLQPKISDTAWVTGTERIPGPTNTVYKGVCLLPTADKLADGLALMKRARPLGFARLVLVRRGAMGSPKPEDIYYVSPLLRMHYDAGDKPPGALPYSAYAWSVREHPGASKIAAIWVFGIPKGALAKAMVTGNTRSLTIAQLVDAAKKLPSAAASPLGEVSWVLDIASNDDGTVLTWQRYDQHPDKVKNFKAPAAYNADRTKRWGSVTLTDADLAATPYFTSV